MEYQVVKIEEKVVVGNSVDTTYADNKCFADLPQVWSTFLEGGIYPSINNKTDEKPTGLYYNQKMNNGVLDFSFMSCCEVSEFDNEELTMVTIPASNYAKFVIKGQTPEDVSKAWETIGAMELDRNTGYDYEVYNMDAEDAKDRTLECYVSIK